ncbi:hypothetical protein [Halanaerobaculum tunisiense]
MDQLTQGELKEIKDQMSTTALAMKKYQIYQQETQDSELKQIFQEGEQLHHNQLQTLLDQLRNFNGQEQ